MVKRRSKNEIIGSILILLSNGYKSRSDIRHALGINSRRLDSILFLLISNGLVISSNDNIIITDKGLYFLNLYKELMALLGIDYSKVAISRNH